MAGAAQEKQANKPAASSLAGLAFGLLSKGKNPHCIQGASAAHGPVALAYIYVYMCIFIHLYLFTFAKDSILCAAPGHWCSVAHRLANDSSPRKGDTRLYVLLFKQ